MNDYQTIISQAEEFVFDLFKRKLPEYLVYHTFAHTEGVAKSAHKIAAALSLGEDGIELVTLAAWLHDTGYTELYKGHEEVSVRIATEFLRSRSYPDQKIELVAGCIRATRIPQTPKNILEEIVADADLASLGKKSFFKQGELLRIEWERAQGRFYSDEEWIEQNIDLLSKHTYFTRAAQQFYAAKQAEHLRTLYKMKAEQPKPETTEPAHEPEIAPNIDGGTPSIDLPVLMLMVDKAIRLITLANRKATFFVVANIIAMLLIVSDAAMVSHTLVFGRPYMLLTAAFLLSFFSSLRTLSYRTSTHPGTITADRLHLDLQELDATLDRKETTNQWVVIWFALGVIIGVITHLLFGSYPDTYLHFRAHF